MGLNYVQISQDYPERNARPVSAVNKRLILLLLLLPPCALLVVFFLGFLPDAITVSDTQEWKTDEALLIYDRSVKRGDNSSCLSADNTFANAGILPNTDDPSLMTFVFFLRFLIDIAVQETVVQKVELKSKLIQQGNFLRNIRRRVDTPCDDGHEKEIASSLFLLNEYLKHFRENNENVKEDALQNLAQNLELLFDELIVGQSDVNIYLARIIWDAINCIDERSGTKLDTLLGFVVGKLFDLHHYNMQNVNSQSYSNSTRSVARQLLNRIQDDVLQMRIDEDDVVDEMRRAVEMIHPKDDGLPDVADSLLRFLEGNYKTRKWLVVVAKNQLDYDHSRGFRSVHLPNNTLFVAAISADRYNSPAFSQVADDLLNDFQFPIATVSNVRKFHVGLGLSLKAIDGAHDIHQYFNRYLTPSWTNGRLGIESIAITTTCPTDGKKMDNFISVSASKGMLWKRVTNQDHCANKQVIVVPTTDANETDEPNNHDHNSGILRNEYGRAYLSVEGNLKGKEAFVHVDREWHNSTGQRWRFVNNQLVNDNGKCLTAWTEKSWYLYQYDCHPDWAGQIWIRHGLQIVNGFRFCLAFIDINNNDLEMYAIQDTCDSTPPFLWYDWDVACKKTV